MRVRDPIVELHETKLYQYLLSRDSEYAQRIDIFVQGVAPILATTSRFFPYYTRHDAHHGFRVVRRIEQSISSEAVEVGHKAALGAAEIFLLIAAAYAHDVGMTVFPGEAEALVKRLGVSFADGWETAPALQHYLRREHSNRGGEYVHQNAVVLGVPLHLVGALDLLMRSHNLSIPELDLELRTPFAADERQIDVRQLAVMVCIGDALEFSDTRVIDGVLDAIGSDSSNAARISYRENMKHVCIGDSVAVDPDGRVVVSGTFSDPDVLALAHRTFDQMEEWIRGYCDIERQAAVRRLRVTPEQFIRNLRFMGGRFERLGVRLNKKNVIDLIASNAVWRTKGGVAVRELIQNAVEACRYRAHHSSAADRYHPTVRVTFDRASNALTVSDNGCGMSERTVLNNLLTVGSSRSKEPSYVEQDYAPIARFGIGFWSVFTIADRAHVETTAFEKYRGIPEAAAIADGISFDVALDEMKDYTVFTKVQRPCGTRIVLSLKADVVLDEIFAQVREQVICCEVDTTLVVDGEETPICRSVPEVTDSDILGARQRIQKELGVRVFRWRGSCNDTELTLGLVYRMEQGKATFLREPGSSLLSLLGHRIRRGRTAVCGFVVSLRPTSLCFDLMRVGTYCANHRTPRGFEFAIDRQQLLQNPASDAFARNVASLIHDAYRAFLDETRSRDPGSIAALNEQSAMHGGNVFDSFTGSELIDACEHYPDLLCFRLFPVTREKLNETSVQHVSLSQLRSMSGQILFTQNRAYAPALGGRQYHFDPEGMDALRTVYAYATRVVSGQATPKPVFVAEARRSLSMLFDADPHSSLIFTRVPIFGDICIQQVQLERVGFDRPPEDILAEVQGRWTGAIYLRVFKRPNGKPYMFLGRHRVLIQKSSKLAEHLRNLLTIGRRIKLAETIADLQEDDSGYTPEAVAPYVDGPH